MSGSARARSPRPADPVPYLFDTDAISEVLRPKPAVRFVDWLATIPRAEQYTSAVTLGELYKGAYRSRERARHLENIEKRVIPALTVLPYERSAARVFGQIRADLEERGAVLPDADLQIAAIALYHGLELVTGTLRHFERIPGLRVNRALADARQG
jgi:tRNA(fMet)-specific endonuclease VapC